MLIGEFSYESILRTVRSLIQPMKTCLEKKIEATGNHGYSRVKIIKTKSGSLALLEACGECKVQ